MPDQSTTDGIVDSEESSSVIDVFQGARKSSCRCLSSVVCAGGRAACSTTVSADVLKDRGINVRQAPDPVVVCDRPNPPSCLNRARSPSG